MNDERKRESREARKAAKKIPQETKAPVHHVGSLRDWRIVGGGVKLVEEEYDPEKEEQDRLKIELIDQMYQESLARRLQKVQSHSQQEIEEFEEAIRVVKKQIEAQQIREAKLRRRMRVKTEPSGVLICGDRIEKIAYTEKLVQKKVVENWEDRMESIVTVRIEGGQSVQVANKNSPEPPRVENGPQVLILASSERLVGTTFLINSRNASFKPEFNWQISLHPDAPSFSSASIYSFDTPSPSYSYSYSFSFDTPSPSSNPYDIPGLDSASQHSFSFETDDTSQNGNRYSFDDESRAPQFGFVAHEDDASEAKETIEQRLARLLYHYEELQTTHNRLTSVYNEGFMPESEFQRQMDELNEQIGPDVDLGEEIEKIQTEIDTRNTSAQKDGAQRDDAGDEGGEGRTAERGRGRGGRGMERGRGFNQRGGGMQRPAGMDRGGRGGRGMERGRGMSRGGAGMERGGRGTERGGRGNARGARGGDRQESRPTLGLRSRAMDRGRGMGRGMRGSGMRGMVGGRVGWPRVSSSWDAISETSVNDTNDTESVASDLSSVVEGASWDDPESIIKTDIEKCQTLLRYLKRFLSADEIEKHPKLQKYIRGISGTPDKDDELREETEKGGEAEIMADYGGENGEENGMAHADENGMENGHENGIDEEENKGNGKGKAKHKENKKKDEDLDYLSSSMFLTDDDEGHFYEKDKEDDNSRKTKKKKTKPKQQKTLFFPVQQCYLFAQIDLFPPQTLANVAKSIDDVCRRFEKYNNELQILLDERRRKEEERARRRQNAREEKEKAEASPWAAQMNKEEREKGEGEGEGEDGKEDGESHDSQDSNSDADDDEAEDALGEDNEEGGGEDYAGGEDAEGEWQGDDGWGTNANEKNSEANDGAGEEEMGFSLFD